MRLAATRVQRFNFGLLSPPRPELKDPLSTLFDAFLAKWIEKSGLRPARLSKRTLISGDRGREVLPLNPKYLATLPRSTASPSGFMLFLVLPTPVRGRSRTASDT